MKFYENQFSENQVVPCRRAGRQPASQPDRYDVADSHFSQLFCEGT